MARGIGEYSRAKLIRIIDQRVSSEGGDGDITSVTAGNGLTGGGTTGDLSIAVDIGGSDGQLLYNDGTTDLGGVSSLSFNDSTGDLQIIDDKKLIFGTNNDSHIEYNENGDDFLIISGSSAGMVLSGSTIQIRGTLVGASPLQIAGGIEIVSLAGEATTAMSFGDNIKLNFGDENDTYIKYNTVRSANSLEISGSVGGGIRLLGEKVYVDKFLGIGVSEDDITHAITLPNNANTSGQIKANAYVTYSSARLKENITQINNPIEILNKIQGVTFDWKNNKKKDIGFIAEDVGKYLPHIVTWEKNNLDAQGLDYNKIIPILVEAIKHQEGKIDALRRDLIKLKNLIGD